MAIKRIGVLTSGGDAPGMSRLWRDAATGGKRGREI